MYLPFVMEPAGSVTELAEVPMVQVEAGQWHSLEVQEEAYQIQGVYPELVEGRRRMGGMSRWQMKI